MRKLKNKVEICKLPSMTPEFLPRYREACKLPPSTHWSPSQGNPRKGQAPGRVNSVDSPGPSPCASGSPVCLSRTAPHYLHYQAFGRNAAGLVPSGTQWQPHHKHGWCDLARLQAPPMYNNWCSQAPSDKRYANLTKH